jgi:D-ribose pyranase
MKNLYDNFGVDLYDNFQKEIQAMLQTGILNPDILHLLARIRHTNTLVISDWAFPYWPEIETVDISLTRGVPTVLQVLELLKPNFKIGRVLQAEEFLNTNPQETVNAYNTSFEEIPGVAIERLAHIDFKKLVPGAIGLIRTGDTTAYGNIILESA